MRSPVAANDLPVCVEAQPQPTPVPTTPLKGSAFSVPVRSPLSPSSTPPLRPLAQRGALSSLPLADLLAPPKALVSTGLPMSPCMAQTPFPSAAAFTMSSEVSSAFPSNVGGTSSSSSDGEGILLGTIVLPPMPLGPEGLKPILDSFPKDLPSLLAAAWENGVHLEVPQALQPPSVLGVVSQPHSTEASSTHLGVRTPNGTTSPFLAPVVLEGSRAGSRASTPVVPSRSPGLSPAVTAYPFAASPSGDLVGPPALALPPTSSAFSMPTAPATVAPMVPFVSLPAEDRRPSPAQPVSRTLRPGEPQPGVWQEHPLGHHCPAVEAIEEQRPVASPHIALRCAAPVAGLSESLAPAWEL